MAFFESDCPELVWSQNGLTFKYFDCHSTGKSTPASQYFDFLNLENQLEVEYMTGKREVEVTGKEKKAYASDNKREGARTETGKGIFHTETSLMGSKVHHQQNKEDMDFQEDFFKNQLKNIHDARVAKEDIFERLQQKRQKVKQSKARREYEIANFIKSRYKEIEEFVSERDKLMQTYEEEKAEMKLRHHEEEVELEKKIDAQLNELMAKYTPLQYDSMEVEYQRNKI